MFEEAVRQFWGVIKIHPGIAPMLPVRVHWSFPLK